MIIFGVKKRDIFESMKIFEFFLKYMRKLVGARAEIFTSWNRSQNF
jgi:hypothetical protein